MINCVSAQNLKSRHKVFCYIFIRKLPLGSKKWPEKFLLRSSWGTEDGGSVGVWWSITFVHSIRSDIISLTTSTVTAWVVYLHHELLLESRGSERDVNHGQNVKTINVHASVLTPVVSVAAHKLTESFWCLYHLQIWNNCYGQLSTEEHGTYVAQSKIVICH